MIEEVGRKHPAAERQFDEGNTIKLREIGEKRRRWEEVVRTNDRGGGEWHSPEYNSRLVNEDVGAQTKASILDLILKIESDHRTGQEYRY